MPPVQTSYDFKVSRALAGLIYDMGSTDIDSFAAEVDIPFGVFVRRGTDGANQVLLGNATSIGVSVRIANENEYKVGNVSNIRYLAKETVGVLREGYIWAVFNAAGGTLGAAVTINASGQVVAAGGATALTTISATIEKPAVALTVDGTTMYVGLVKVGA